MDLLWSTKVDYYFTIFLNTVRTDLPGDPLDTTRTDYLYTRFPNKFSCVRFLKVTNYKDTIHDKAFVYK